MADVNGDYDHKGVTLKEYMDRRFDALEDILNTRLDAIDRETTLAKKEMDRRLEAMNEFREQLSHQAATFIGRSEHDLMMERYNADIRYLRECWATSEGKASQRAVYIAYAIGALGLIIALVAILIPLIK